MKLLNILAVPLVGARVIRTPQQQVPIVGEQRPGPLTQTYHRYRIETVDVSVPTVGVHFTTSYAIASARYQNGTARDLGKVEGDAEYIDLMSRWVNGEDELSRDCQDVNSSQCQKATLERDVRRNAGLPVTEEAATLARFIKKARIAIEDEMGEPIDSIAPVFPRFPKFLGNEVKSALAYAGILSTRRWHMYTAFDEANAAYVGFDHGSCVDHARCPEDRKLQTVLYLNFDNSSMSVGAMQIKSGWEPNATFSYGTNTNLGWWNLPVFEIPRAKFWAQIHEMIAAIVRPIGRAPNKIILLGEHGADDEFKEVVKAAVWEVLELDVEMMLGAVKKEDVTHLAARGAAELGFWDESWLGDRDSYGQKPQSS